jgi:hypothetical protein
LLRAKPNAAAPSPQEKKLLSANFARGARAPRRRTLFDVRQKT